VKSSHNLDRFAVTFDAPSTVAHAGLLLPMSLAHHLGLGQLVDRHVKLGRAAGAPNPGRKAITVVASLLAGGDCIEDADALRKGGTAAVLGDRVGAPSTVGTFLPTIRRGTFWMREVATSRLDKMLTFYLVPTTTIWNDGPYGPGSLQEWVEGATPARIDRSRRPVGYSQSDSQRMGVLDYIAGAGDRQRDNYLTGPDGRPVGIDNGCTFPTPTRLPIRFPIRSDFTALHVCEELNPRSYRRSDPRSRRWCGGWPVAADWGRRRQTVRSLDCSRCSCVE
jgi:hypothetical protein